MKLTTEMNGVTVQITSNQLVNLTGLTPFMQSLTNANQPKAQAPVVVRRGRGRPPGAKNKPKKGTTK